VTLTPKPARQYIFPTFYLDNSLATLSDNLPTSAAPEHENIRFGPPQYD